MLITYLKIALRNMMRQKSFSVINILGLTIGLTAFLAIALYVTDELSYDRFHAQADRIYRAVITADFDGQTTKWGGAPNLLAPTAAKEIPEVEKASRYFHHNFGDLAFVSKGKDQFSEKELFFADPEFFQIFTVPFIKGDAATALSRINTVVLSESAAKKYFSDADPIGKTLKVDNAMDLEVTGVYRDFPSNSFLQANLIASFSSNWFGQDKNQNWGNASFDTFMLLHSGTSRETADIKIEDMLKKNIAQDRRWFNINLQALTDIRLYSGELNAAYDRRSYGDIGQVKILSALAAIILLIAAVNYMNLTTAQSQRRNKEVGINKTLGATFSQLSFKFYFEAGLFVAIAMVISLCLFTLILPVFNVLSGKEISSDFITKPLFWAGFTSIWLVLSFLSGFYPAWYLSAFSPKTALQKTAGSGQQGSIRKVLVVAQFAASIMLIICTLVFYQQMNFIRDKKLGYQPEQVIAVMTTGSKDRESTLAVKTAYENLSDVVSVARSQSYPGVGTSMRSIVREGVQDDGESLLTARATHEILKTLNIQLLAGTTLAENKDSKDTTVQVVVNKATADYLGLTPEEAVGKRVTIQGFDGLSEIVGVMDDFHFTSLHQKIGAFCFHNGNRTESYNYLLVKVNSSNLAATLKQLENIYKKTINTSFEYSFLDEHLARLYESEKNLASIVLIFASLAIIVACLGLYALAAFTAEQRTKEIGIRKVMGATVPHLVRMLSRDFIILVVIAIGIGIPAGYYVMNQWLNGFAYRIDIGISVFLVGGVISLVIAWLTVSIEAFKAANTNPAKSLKSE